MGKFLNAFSCTGTGPYDLVADLLPYIKLVLEFIGTTCSKIVFIAYDYGSYVFVLCLGKGTVYESWAERRFVWSRDDEQIVKICGKKLGLAFFDVPSDKFIPARNNGKNLSLFFLKVFIIKAYNIARSKRIVITRCILKNFALDGTVA